MPLPLSSGDPLLDRRLEWACGLMQRDEAAAAAALLAETTVAAPKFLAAWFALGEACEQSAAPDEAAVAFRRALALDPADRLGASLRLTRLGAEPAAMPPAYVRVKRAGWSQAWWQSSVAAEQQAPRKAGSEREQRGGEAIYKAVLVRRLGE